MALFDANGNLVRSDGMTLADYVALYDAVVHMSCDIEDSVSRFGDEDWDEVAAAKYALIQEMVNCINDVPARLVKYAVENGLQLPEIDCDFSGDEPITVIDGVDAATLEAKN